MVDWGLKWDVEELEYHPEPRGDLTAVNDIRKLPFMPGRVYWITGLQPGHQRGSHAHKVGRQAFVVQSGQASFSLYDQKQRHEVVTLDRPNQLLVVESLVWLTMLDFTPGTVVLCFADKVYDPDDYLRDEQGWLAYAAPAPRPVSAAGLNTGEPARPATTVERTPAARPARGPR